MADIFARFSSVQGPALDKIIKYYISSALTDVAITVVLKLFQDVNNKRLICLNNELGLWKWRPVHPTSMRSFRLNVMWDFSLYTESDKLNRASSKTFSSPQTAVSNLNCATE